MRKVVLLLVILRPTDEVKESKALSVACTILPGTTTIAVSAHIGSHYRWVNEWVMITVLCYHSLPGSSPQTATWQPVLSSVWCPPWSFISLHCFPCQYLTEVPFMADLSSHPSPACALLRKESSLKCWEQPGNQAETLYSLSSNRSIFHRVQKSSLHLWGPRARDKIKIYFHILYYLQLSWQQNILYVSTLIITPSWWFHRSSSNWGNSDSSKWHNIAGKKEHLQRPKDPSLALFQFASQSNSSLSHKYSHFQPPNPWVTSTLSQSTILWLSLVFTHVHTTVRWRQKKGGSIITPGLGQELTWFLSKWYMVWWLQAYPMNSWPWEKMYNPKKAKNRRCTDRAPKH